MDITIEILPYEDRNTGFSAVRLHSAEAHMDCSLDVNLSQAFEKTNTIPPNALDFLFIAAVVYAIDKHLKRQVFSEDGWTRNIAAQVPVSAPEVWTKQAQAFSECVSFLTGDLWEFSFVRLSRPLALPPRNFGRHLLSVGLIGGECVSLFSGGLDSYIGAIDWLEEHPKESLVLVGHYDGDIKGPHADQEALFKCLTSAYRKRVQLFQMRVGANPAGAEISLRSRSLVFVALGLYAAECVAKSISLLIPENGVIALNMPLTPARRGSCSTRTAHPFFISSLEEILCRVGIVHQLKNPYASNTKGEMVRNCRSPGLLKSTAQYTVSCAKNGHTFWWENRSASGCGRCVPCLYRRAALHAMGLDNEPYGYNIGKSTYVLESSNEGWNDLTALLDFLRQNPNPEQIGNALLANGPLPLNKIDDYADVIERMKKEMASFIQSKGGEAVRRAAGLIK
jgi:hypothetical protein